MILEFCGLLYDMFPQGRERGEGIVWLPYTPKDSSHTNSDIFDLKTVYITVSVQEIFRLKIFHKCYWSEILNQYFNKTNKNSTRKSIFIFWKYLQLIYVYIYIYCEDCENISSFEYRDSKAYTKEWLPQSSGSPLCTLFVSGVSALDESCKSNHLVTS